MGQSALRIFLGHSACDKWQVRFIQLGIAALMLFRGLKLGQQCRMCGCAITTVSHDTFVVSTPNSRRMLIIFRAITF